MGLVVGETRIRGSLWSRLWRIGGCLEVVKSRESSGGFLNALYAESADG